MKLEALDHPKTMDLAARLEVELPTAIGYLELLWAFTGKKAPQGNIGKWPDGAIARACYWMGRPELFTQALVAAGFLDESTDHRLTVHDWKEHAPRWVKSKLSSLGVSFVNCEQPDVGRDTGQDTSPDTGRDSKGREGKASEAKGDAQARATPGLNLEAWEVWTDYRRSIGKPLKPASMTEAAKKLASFGKDQGVVVSQSIAQGWQGLFALKDVPRGTNGKAGEADRRRVALERISAHAEAISCPLQPREHEPAEAFETRVKGWERDNCRPPPGEPKFAVAALAAAKRVNA